MVFSFLYLAVRALLGALVRSRRGLHHVKDIELLVLRHDPNPTSDEKDRRRARSAAATGSAASSTSTTEAPPDV